MLSDKGLDVMGDLIIKQIDDDQIDIDINESLVRQDSAVEDMIGTVEGENDKLGRLGKKLQNL